MKQFLLDLTVIVAIVWLAIAFAKSVDYTPAETARLEFLMLTGKLP